MSKQHWASVWGNAVSVAENRPERYAKDITIRYGINMPFSGTAIRLTFDNYCGTEPVTLTKTTAFHGGEFYPVYFGGARSVTIGAGETVVSDPLELTITAGEMVQVSFYLGDFTLMRSVVYTCGPLSGGLYANGDETARAHLSMETSRDQPFSGDCISFQDTGVDLNTYATNFERFFNMFGLTDVVMLTGDNRDTARALAGQAGIEDVHAELLPADKVDLVSRMQGPVIMVGDGVNDAPVLAAADVGIAMGARGSTAASESADAVIVRDDVERVVRAVEVGQHTYKVALTAIWIGIVLSLGLMVVAAFGHIPPVVGALTQEFVDLAAILYALRALTGGKRDVQPQLTRPTADLSRNTRVAESVS